jgi:hypothetical protein
VRFVPCVSWLDLKACCPIGWSGPKAKEDLDVQVESASF